MKKNSRFKRPSGIVAARVAVGTNPPMLSSSGPVYLFTKGHQPTRYARVAAPKKSTTTSSSTTTTEPTPNPTPSTSE